MRTIEEHLSIASAAERLEVSRSTIERLVRRGKATNGREGIFPVVMIASDLRIPASSMQRYLNSRRVSL